MTDQKYIQNQKAFIKRERRIILRDHATASSVLIVLLALFIFLSAGFEHPDSWQEATITLERYATVHTGRAGSRLDIYDTDGNRYTINRNEGNIKQQLVVGHQYTFTYADNFFHNTVEVIKIGNTEYLDRNDSMKNYWGVKIFFWVLIGIIIIGLVVVNLFVYYTATSDRVKRIHKYRKRIYDKEHKMK